MRLLRVPERCFAVQRRVHVARGDDVDADGVGGPFGGEGSGELGDGGFGGAGVFVFRVLGSDEVRGGDGKRGLLVGALLLRVEDAEAGDGGEEDDGAARRPVSVAVAVAVAVAGEYHAAGAGLGDEEGAGEVGVEEGAEEGGVVGFGFDVGTVFGSWF